MNSWFLLESFLRFFAVPIKVRIEEAFHRDVDAVDLLQHSGVRDVAVVLICFSLGLTELGLWFRLIRLLFITSSFFELVPHIDVLMVSIFYGYWIHFWILIISRAAWLMGWNRLCSRFWFSSSPSSSTHRLEIFSSQRMILITLEHFRYQYTHSFKYLHTMYALSVYLDVFFDVD